MVDGSSCLSVAVAIGADDVNLACTAVFFAQEKRYLNPVPGKWNLILNQKLGGVIANAFIRRPA